MGRVRVDDRVLDDIDVPDEWALLNNGAEKCSSSLDLYKFPI
jgi:hypothetical protein